MADRVSGPDATGPLDPAEQLGQLWRRGEQPDVDAFLAAARPLSPAAVASVLCVDQRQRWQAGQRVAVEDYLRRHPQLSADPEAALDLIFHEFLLRERAGERPAAEEYLARFPQYASTLAEQIQLHRAVAGGDSGLTRPGPEAGETGGAGSEAAPGQPSVPGYEILGELGRGGMGVVYKARHVALDRMVALKMVLSGEYASAQERARFRTEALAVARLQHPNVVQVFEVGEHQGHPYLALEYVAGGSLAERLHGGPLPSRQAVTLVEQLARAVQAAHDKGIVHRDLKPANVLLAEDGTPRIADFGLAKRIDAQTAATQTGAILGTPAYMAPEQAGGKSGEIGPTADVWALGVLLYEMLTGRTPFQAATATDTILRVLSDDPVPPRQLVPMLPRDLETITLHCLRKESDRRYPTAAGLADDLRRFLAGEPIRARPLSLRERLWRRRRRLPAAGLTLLVLALLGVGVHALLGWQRERQDRAFDEALAGGTRLLEARKAKDAIASFDEALRLRPDSSPARTERGAAHALLGDYDHALADYDEALRLDPENVLAYRRRGWVFLTLRRYRDAVADLDRVTRGSPRDPLAWRLRATAHLGLQRWSDAAGDLVALSRLAPLDSELYRLRAIVHAAGQRWADAVQDDAKVSLFDDQALFTAAAAALAGGDQDRYRTLRDRLVTLAETTGGGMAMFNRPVSPYLYAARACALVEVPTESDRQRLARLEEQARRHQVRDTIFTLRVQALVWLRVGRRDDAVKQLQAGLKAAPYYSPGINHLLLSMAYRKQGGKKRDADLALERAVQEGIPTAHVHDTLEYQVLLREAREARRP